MKNHDSIYAEVEDVQIGVEAKVMEKTKKGGVKDLDIDDEDHHAYKFAKMFTENYDVIADIYPIFKRLK